MKEALQEVLAGYSLLTSFVVLGAVTWVSWRFSGWLTKGRLHWSAVAVFAGLAMAYAGGWATGGEKGVADLPVLAGMGLLGGAMLRDLAIVATTFGVRLQDFRGMEWTCALSLLLGIFVSFFAGAAVAYAFGYRDAVSMTTIGGGAATYIVGPVTGSALGASSEVMALSVAAGLVKAILVMTVTPFLARFIGLDNPRAAMVFGGLMGTTAGVVAGLTATNPKLVPYGAMTASLYTGLGCLLGPSAVYLILRTAF